MRKPFVFEEEPLATAFALRRLADDLESMTVFQPSREELSEAPLISAWYKGRRAVQCLVGHVDRHPILGTCGVITSELFAIDLDTGWARTANRFYRLGQPRFAATPARRREHPSSRIR